MMFERRRGRGKSREKAAAGVYAGLLDSFRTLASGPRAPAVVVAGIDEESRLEELLEGLEAQASERGVRVFWARLTMESGRRLLRPVEEESGGPAALDLGATPPSERVRAWFNTAGTGYDLVLVAAPALESSLDAALLACDADGLVLAVEQLTTQRQILRESVERAKATGCRVLGLVITEHRDWLPRWLGKLLQAYPRTIETPRRKKGPHPRPRRE